jgi:CheY-like chemotaxis protein
MKKILIIDDDAELRHMMKTVLSLKYDLREAGSKKEGLTALKKFAPDLVILDVMMETETAGFELAREIKSNKKSKQVKILMITSIDRKEQLDFKSEAGDAAWLPVDDYVVKPIEPQTLLLKVEKLAPARS